MKKLLCLLLSLLMVMSAIPAFAAEYQQHLANEATFASLEDARAAESDEMAALTGRAYMPDPALETYPEGTTWVYRSAGIYTPLSAAPRMNTNILVYVDKTFESDDDALAFIKDLGLTDLADQATGSVVLVTPADGVAFGQKDQYAFFLLQAAMTNIGGSTGGSPSTYYADNCYYGGLTYRYVIGIDGGATFINDYIAGALDDISRVAGLLLFVIGAPVGSLVKSKRGGLGAGLIISVLFFVIYYVINISGSKLARDGAVETPVGPVAEVPVCQP